MIMAFNFTDIILLIGILLVLGVIIYFSFIKNRKENKGCSKCAYNKNCKNKNNCHK